MRLLRRALVAFALYALLVTLVLVGSCRAFMEMDQ